MTVHQHRHYYIALAAVLTEPWRALVYLLSRELIPIHRLLGRSCQRLARCSGNEEGVSFIHPRRPIAGWTLSKHSSAQPSSAAIRKKGDQRTVGVELKTAVLIRPRSSPCARASDRISGPSSSSLTCLLLFCLKLFETIGALSGLLFSVKATCIIKQNTLKVVLVSSLSVFLLL